MSQSIQLFSCPSQLNDAVKEQNGRGYRGAKTQSSFEDKLARMGFLDDEKERKQFEAGEAGVNGQELKQLSILRSNPFRGSLRSLQLMMRKTRSS